MLWIVDAELGHSATSSCKQRKQVSSSIKNASSSLLLLPSNEFRIKPIQCALQAGPRGKARSKQISSKLVASGAVGAGIVGARVVGAGIVGAVVMVDGMVGLGGQVGVGKVHVLESLPPKQVSKSLRHDKWPPCVVHHLGQ